MHRVVDRGSDQVLEHLLVVADQAWIDRDTLRFVFSGHGDLHHAAAGFADHFESGDFRLRALHAGLQLLRLFHDIADTAFHRNPAVVMRDAGRDAKCK